MSLDPERLALPRAVLEGACGLPPHKRTHEMRSSLAVRILKYAGHGELSPIRLRTHALTDTTGPQSLPAISNRRSARGRLDKKPRQMRPANPQGFRTTNTTTDTALNFLPTFPNPWPIRQNPQSNPYRSRRRSVGDNKSAMSAMRTWPMTTYNALFEQGNVDGDHDVVGAWTRHVEAFSTIQRRHTGHSFHTSAYARERHSA